MNVNELPQYKCHKVVRAGKILTTAHNPNEDAVFLDIDGLDNKWLSVPAGWLSKHNPDIGGYLVAYEDSYLSYSPAEAFEAGYHALPPLGTACGGTGDAAPANTGFLWRKKPVVIEARQFNGGWTGDGTEILDWMVKGGEWNGDTKELSIHTLEGVMTASKGDWIIKGVSGEFYPCKPDIFAATYEPADAPIIDLDAADFSDALMWLKEGRRVARAGWNGKNQFVVLVKPGFYDVGCSTGAKAGALQPFLALKNAQDMFQPGWIPSMGDLMATDWRVVA